MARPQLSNRNWLRVPSSINDNYCVKCVNGLKDLVDVSGKFGPTTSVSQKEGLYCDQQERDCKFACNSCVVNPVLFAKGYPQKKGVNPSYCYHCQRIRYVKDVSRVDHLSSVDLVTNAPTVAPDLPVGARLHQFSEKWAALVASHKVVIIFREVFSIHPPLPVPAKFDQASNCHKLLYKSPQEPLLVGGIASASEQKCSSQGGEIQNGDTGNHQNVPPTRGVGYLSRLQGYLLPHTSTGTVQEISKISCPGQNVSVQSTVPISHGVYDDSKGGEADGHTQGYKDPPVPRQLVGEFQVPPNLSPAYTGSSKNVSGTGLTGEFRKIMDGHQTSLRLCRLPVRPRLRSGPTDTGPVAEPSTKNTGTAIPAGLSGPSIHVLNRSANCHREASSPRPTTRDPYSCISKTTGEYRNHWKRSFQSPGPCTHIYNGGWKKAMCFKFNITPTKT